MTEQQAKLSPAVNWKIVSPTRPILYPYSAEETWYLTPPWRYVLASDTFGSFAESVSSVSDLAGSGFYRPLSGLESLEAKKVLIERHRERGIGDYLFMTGVLSYLQSQHGNKIEVYWHAPMDKSSLLVGNEDLHGKISVNGPIVYDCLPRYDRHWLVATASEYSEEPDQTNVYDNLLQQIGVDPGAVAPRYKRPKITLTEQDTTAYRHFKSQLKIGAGIDLDSREFVVVAPFARATLRSANYSMWLELIAALGSNYAVLVLGDYRQGMMPETDMPCEEFLASVSELERTNKSIISLVGRTKPRLAASIMSHAEAAVSLDSGLLYVAQAVDTPVVSIWGTHSPQTRIGYDRLLMSLAIHNQSACPNSPCFANRAIPVAKCPRGAEQQVCAPIIAVTVGQILEKIEKAVKA